jgi:hypothetical protein
MTPRNIILERREKTRKVPEQFAFLQLEQDDGGTVLDISEGGLRFESFDPVPEDGQIHFWFSLNLRERIEGCGEVAWIDPQRKSGGLKFLSLSEGGREQIRQYISCSSSPQTPAKTESREPDAVANFVSRARPLQITRDSSPRVSSRAGSPFQAPPEPEVSGVLVPMKRHLAVMRRQLIVGVLLGALLAGLIAFAAIEFYRYRHENRSAINVPVAAPAQTGPTVGSSSIPPPPTVPSGPSTDVFAISNQKNAAARTRVPSPSPGEPGEPTGRQKIPLTPDKLWTLVQAGNGTAATALAELYIKGEGVPQSCAQARVLLLMASEKRNATAIKRLAELDKQGCSSN